MSNTTKIVLIVVVIVALLFGAYLVFFNSNSSQTAVSAQTAPASAAEVSFLQLANTAESVSFDTSILADPRFASLVDIHTAVIPEQEGRKDPFAALSGSTSGN